MEIKVKTSQFGQLLDALPEVAEAVNKFSSDAVQQDAFRALLSSWSTEFVSAPIQQTNSGGARAAKSSDADTMAGVDVNGNGGKRRKPPITRKQPSFMKELDLHPKGVPSLAEFVSKRSPKTNHERNVLVVYYLWQLLDLDEVSPDHVFTAYREMNWKLPSDMRNALAQTASKKGWIDSADMEHLRVTPHGINAVEHDLIAAS